MIVRRLIAPSQVSDADCAAVAGWLDNVRRGGEYRPFDLRAEIERRGMTAVSFAAAAGVTERLVRYWLRAERQPSAYMARRIAAALGMHPSRVVTKYVIRKSHVQVRDPYDPTRQLVGRNLAAARRACRLTQKQLAAIVGHTQQAVASCESERRPPNSNALVAVQRAIANRLRRRGYTTVTKVERKSRKVTA